MLQLTAAQMQMFTDQALARTVKDIIEALNKRFATESNCPDAVNWRGMEPSDHTRLVDQIVKIGWSQGFQLRGEMYALVEACVAYDPRKLLADPVLEHKGLTPMEKVRVMVELYQEWGRHIP